MSGAAVQRNALGEVARWQGSESLFASRRWRDVALTLASSFCRNDPSTFTFVWAGRQAIVAVYTGYKFAA